MTNEQHVKLNILTAEAVGMITTQKALEMIKEYDLENVIVPLTLLPVPKKFSYERFQNTQDLVHNQQS